MDPDVLAVGVGDSAEQMRPPGKGGGEEKLLYLGKNGAPGGGNG